MKGYFLCCSTNAFRDALYWFYGFSKRKSTLRQFFITEKSVAEAMVCLARSLKAGNSRSWLLQEEWEIRTDRSLSFWSGGILLFLFLIISFEITVTIWLAQLGFLAINTSISMTYVTASIEYSSKVQLMTALVIFSAPLAKNTISIFW